MQDYKKISDEELLTQLHKSEVAAFDELFNRYWEKLYAAAYKRLKSREGAEEIVQDVFTRLWDRRTEIQIHTALAGYLFTSVRYRVINYIQKEGIRVEYRESLAVNMAYDNSTEDTVLLNDLSRNIDKQLTNLPPKCRSVFELSRKDHKTNREIAEVLGISEKTVENHLTKAIKRLRVGLAELSRMTIWLF